MASCCLLKPKPKKKKKATGANSFLIRASSLITTWSCWFAKASGSVLSVWGRERHVTAEPLLCLQGWLPQNGCANRLLLAGCWGWGDCQHPSLCWAFFLKMSRWSLHFPSLLSCLAGQEKATGKCQPWDQRDQNWGNKKIPPPYLLAFRNH